MMKAARELLHDLMTVPPLDLPGAAALAAALAGCDQLERESAARLKARMSKRPHRHVEEPPAHAAPPPPAHGKKSKDEVK